MARWLGDTNARLRAAALSLFEKKGFDETTAVEIAEAAGVTERTFYRYFTDKREVLFAGSEALVEAFRAGIQAVPEGAPVFEMMTAALTAAAEYFPEERRPYSRQRQLVIQATPALEERELHKAMSIVRLVRAELEARGVAEATAALAAQVTSTIFNLAFVRWIEPGESRSMLALQNQLLTELRALVP